MRRGNRTYVLTSVAASIALVIAAGCSSSRSGAPADTSLPIATTTTVTETTSTTVLSETTVATIATTVAAATSTTAPAVTVATVAPATVPAATFPAATVPLPTAPPPVAPDTTTVGATVVTAPPPAGTGRYVTNPADNVRLGDTGPAVQQIQQRLIVYGHTVPVDGVFGQTTKDAVIAFQHDQALSADGVVGKNTWGLLKADPEGGDF